jgi:DNA-binding transcriptional MerR regulator
VTSVAIPNRPVFRAQEVCELAELQPYVLRTWEAEFPDLGVTKGAAGARVYRRADVERVLRIKHLLFVDGLTLAGARKRLSEEGLVQAEEPVIDSDVAALIDGETRQQLREVRRGLQWILAVLGDEGQQVPDFVMRAETAAPRRASKPAASKAKVAAAKSVKKGPPKRGRK